MLSLAIDSLISPRSAIQRVLAWDVDPQAFFLGAGLLACLAGLINGLLAPVTGQEDTGPVVIAIRQAFLMGVMILGVDRVGRAFGGTGDVNGAAKVVVWHGFVEILSTGIVATAAIVVGPAAGAILIALLLWLFAVLAIFIQELHQFKSLAMTIVGLLVAGFVIGIPILFVLIRLGLIDPGSFA